jgi:hypothetical protein
MTGDWLMGENENESSLFVELEMKSKITFPTTVETVGGGPVAMS